MRFARVCVLCLLLCVSFLPAWGDNEAAGASADELAALKAQLASQQQMIWQLQDMLRRQAAILETLERRLSPEVSVAAAAPLAAMGESALEGRVEKLEKSSVGAAKDEEDRWKRLGPLRFGGDIRVRYEPILQSGTEQRHRERMRLRFEATAKLTEELTAGFRLATGGFEDPISTNETFTGFYARKPFDVDRAWLSYRPLSAPWLTLTGGKFAVPWYRTELTFDNDLNPEGFAENFSFDFKESPLERLAVVAFQLPFNEVSSGPDSFLWGGQLQTIWRLNDRSRLGLYAAGIDIHRADPIAVAVATHVIKPSLPLTNSLRFDTNGDVIGFAERFAYLDLIAELNYNWRPRWPVRATFDFVNNLRARRERSGYWGEIELGKTVEPGDWAFGYMVARIERDAVVGPFNGSDLRSSTNVLNHRLHVGYQIHRHVTLEHMFYFGRLFNPQDNLELVPISFRPLNQDPFMKRFQFDIIYRF